MKFAKCGYGNIVLWLFIPFLVSCVSTNDDAYNVQGSRLAKTNYNEIIADTVSETPLKNTALETGYEKLVSVPQRTRPNTTEPELQNAFSDVQQISIAVEDMLLQDLVNTVFGSLLKVNYVIPELLPELEKRVSLQLQKKVTERELFQFVRSLLEEQKITITKRDDVYYVHSFDAAHANIAMGFGRNISDLPAGATITQIVPVRYNRDISIERTLRELTNARIQEVQGQSAYSIQGNRDTVIKAMELLDILDSPAARGRYVGLLRLTYLSVDEFSKQLSELLAMEGLPIDVANAGNRNMAIMPLQHIGALAVFAAEPLYVERVKYWASQLDKPSKSVEKQYFIYYPRFSRSADLGKSVAPLIGRIAEAGNQRRDTQSAQQNTQDNSSTVKTATDKSTASLTVENENIMLTVDERSNLLIFYTTGQHYQNILPMVQRLDVMPKQILLEATIAEVTLTDELAMGLEFAIRNGSFGANTSAFGVAELGGLSLSSVTGLDKIIVNLAATDSRVKVLSSPLLVVRDGVSANINVGSDIPTVGSTTVNPGTETQSTAVQYRKTGVKLTVTPTISAQGFIVMEIDQNISNVLDGGVQIAGSQSFFERSISTEVIAQSGQTILLGGLMSENNNNSVSKVPGLGDLPLLGALFRSQKKSTTKTELVILITPRLIDTPIMWQDIKDNLQQQLHLLKISD